MDFENIDNICYFMTFKIYYNTTFDDLKNAACQFWSERNQKTSDQEDFTLQPEEFILSDEYFNNLATFKDTICNFYQNSSGYKPLNPNCDACIFLFRKNHQRSDLHSLQFESVELQDDNAKKDDENITSHQHINEEDCLADSEEE